MFRSFAVVMLSALLCALCAGCVVRFSKAERGLSAGFRKIYLPSATDITSRGGAAARLSYAVRMQLALRTEISLVPVDEARLALDLQIKNQTRVTSTDLDCTSGKNERQVLASGSVPCKQPLAYGQAEVSAERETAQLRVLARLIDLNSGAVLMSRSFDEMASYPILSDDLTKQAEYANFRQYHALRYMENVDDAILKIGNSIATQIVNGILNLDPNTIR